MKRNLPGIFLSFLLVFVYSLAFSQLPPSMCSPTGGARADLLEARGAYRPGGNTGPVTFTIPVGTASVMVYASSHDSRLTWPGVSHQQQADEDFITINAVLNLKTKKSSGFLNYARNTAPLVTQEGTNLYGWQNVSFGNNVSAHALPGHDTNSSILNDVTFSVTGNTLSIQESNTDIYTSYYVEFVSADVSSLNSNSFESKALLRNNTNTTLSVPIPANTNVIFVSGKGTNGVSDNTTNGGTEEGFSNMRFA